MDEDLKRMAQANMVAVDYANAKSKLEHAQREREAERRALRLMVILWVMALVACFAYLSGPMLEGATSTFDRYDAVTRAVGFPVIALVMVVTFVWIAAMPAGVVGIFRTLARSGWSVWGSLIVMLALFMLVLTVALVFGWVLVLFQLRKTKKLDERVKAAEEGLALVTVAVR